MNERIYKKIEDAHEKTAYASDCLNAWRGKFDSLFAGIVDDPDIKPFFEGMNERELQFQAAYDWMEQNYDVLASNIRMVAELVDKADYLLCDVEAALMRKKAEASDYR